MLDSIVIAIPATLNNVLSFDQYIDISEADLACIFNNPEINTPIKSVKKRVPKIVGDDYYPEVSLYFWTQPVMILIKFSVSKLYFNNNLYEITNADRDAIINTLQTKLLYMDIKVSRQEILDAAVWKLEIAKNILLSNISCNAILSALNKMKFYTKLQTQTTEFRDEYKTRKKYQAGQMFSLWSKKHQLCFYNKLSEIKKDKHGVNLIKQANLTNKQVLRIEYRIFTKSDIAQVLTQYGFDNNVTFGYIFDMELCQKLLFAVWCKIVDKRKNQLKLINCDTEPLTDAFFSKQKQARTMLCTLGAIYLVDKGHSLDEIFAPFPNNSTVLQQIINTIDDCISLKKLNKRRHNGGNSKTPSKSNVLIRAFNNIYKKLAVYKPIRPTTPPL